MWLQLTDAEDGEILLINSDQIAHIVEYGNGAQLFDEDGCPYTVKETLQQITAMLDVQSAQRNIHKLEEALRDIQEAELLSPIETIGRLRKIAREALK